MNNINAGKSFETDFKNSIPDSIYYLRLNDAGGWSNAENTRFTTSNVADCILYYNFHMYLIEFKSHNGSSLPLSCIRENQLKGLYQAHLRHVISGYVINFRQHEETYFIYACDINDFIKTVDRKSVPMSYIQDKGYKINQTKKRTRYTYDVVKMLTDII